MCNENQKLQFINKNCFFINLFTILLNIIMDLTNISNNNQKYINLSQMTSLFMYMHALSISIYINNNNNLMERNY